MASSSAYTRASIASSTASRALSTVQAAKSIGPPSEGRMESRAGRHRDPIRPSEGGPIDFAAWTVDNARLVVLDAIDARVYADELATTAGS